MDNTELMERMAIREMTSRDASLGYLKAKSANVEVTILRGEDIVRIKDGKEEVIGMVKRHYPAPKQGTRYKLR